jgi:ABC-type lipoprotein release transport system permease subunit
VIANFTWVAEKSGVYEVTIKSDLYNDIIEIDETNNNISIRIEVKPLPGVKPDFAVTNIVCSKDNPIENENVVITTNIQSTNITASYGVIVELLVDFTHIDKTVLSIEENNTYTVKFRWTAIAGNHTLTIEVDPENLYTEIDETNNNLTITLTVGMTALSDLTISEIKFIPPRVEEGDTIYILATLQNIGTFDAKNVLITAYHDKIDNSTLIGSVTIDIPQNSKVVIEFIWTAEVGEHIIYLIIDERDTIHETIETNNKVSKNIVVDMKETYTPPPKEKDTDEYPTELWIVIGVILTLLIVHILMDVFRRSKRKKTKLRIYKFAMGNVFRRRSLAAVTILAVVIGIGMYAVIAPMMESMELEMQETMRAFGDITVLQANRTIIDSQIPEYLVSDIENITGVKCAHPFIEYMLFYPGFAEDIYFPMMSWYLGVDIEKNIREDSYLAHITKGRVCRKGANEVVMGWRLKEISEIDVGQRIKLGTVEYEIVGMYNTGVTIADMNLLTSLETARNNPVIAQHIQGKNVTGISVTVLNAEDTPRIANDIKNNVTTPWGPLDVSFPEDLVKKATEGMKTVENTVNMLLLIILGASFMIVTSILYTNIKEREREFAMNKAVGWSNRDVLWCVVVEVLILCLIGGILGAIFGTLLSIYIQSYLQFGSIFISLKSIVGALVIAIILGVLAGLYPGWKASKVRPALVLREG